MGLLRSSSRPCSHRIPVPIPYLYSQGKLLENSSLRNMTSKRGKCNQFPQRNGPRAPAVPQQVKDLGLSLQRLRSLLRRGFDLRPDVVG